MPNPDGSLTAEEIEARPFIPKSVPEGYQQCLDCGGIGSIPIRMRDPAWDPEDPESVEFLEERYMDHAHGSEPCMMCGQNGFYLPS